MHEVTRLHRLIATPLAIALVLVATAGCQRRAVPADEQSATQSAKVPQAQQAPIQPEVLMPEDVVKHLYEAMAREELERANSYFVTDGVLTESHLASWGDPTYQITGTASGAADGELLMEVTEARGGLTGGGKLTYTLRSHEGFWRISGWSSGPIRYPEAPEAEAPEPEFDRDAALVVLSTFFGARMGGDTKAMRACATARMQKEQPEVFTSGAGSFTSADARSFRKEGDAWVVVVDEKWGSATRTETYVVVAQNGKALIDRRR